MKNVYLIILVFSLLSCKKEPVYGPLKLKNGEEVELFVDHRYASDNDVIYTLPAKTVADAPLIGFNEREPGYNYMVKARFRHDNNPPQDGPSSIFEFLSVVRKEQYKGNESFNIQLIWAIVPGGPFIRLNKTGNDYYFVPDKLQLTYANSTVQSQLEEIWQNALLMRSYSLTNRTPKWKAVKATVTHDSGKFGKAYQVQAIEFVN